MEVEKHFIFSCRVDEQPTTATNLHFVILSDKTLQEYLASGRIIIEPLGENAIQPSSVDLRIDWREEATSNPMVLQFDPNPKNGGENPKHIDVSSTVENPSFVEDFSGGQSVEFLWKITDELDDVCQWNTGEVDDGQAQTWNTLHFNTYLIHELSVDYEEGQDLINIDQTVLITYDFD